MKINEQVSGLIADIYPTKIHGKSSLTHKEKTKLERMFMLGYRACLTRVMLGSGQPENEYTLLMEETVSELNSYFAKVADAVEKAE